MALLIILTLPLGLGLLKLLRINCPNPTRYSLSLALGFIFQALLVFFIHYFSLQPQAYSYLWLIALLPLGFLYTISLGREGEFLKLASFLLFVFLILSHLMLFPFADYSLVTAESSRSLSGYYTDNLISFNVARIFTEGLSIPNTVVVPVWSFFDRTPVAGALVAFFWFVFGIKETAAWLGTSPGNFFYYQEQLIFLNLLAVFALGCFMLRKGKKVLPTMAILLVGPFVFLNLTFAWPKFFSSFFAIVALDLLEASIEADSRRIRELLLSGLLLGVAYLTHDTAIFFIVSLLLVLALKAVLSGKLINFRQLSFLFAGMFSAVLPWFIFRYFYETKSSHMLALHLLCVTDFSYQKMTMSQAFAQYLSSNTLWQIFKVKLGNIFYPFSLIDAFKSLKGDYFSFLNWLRVLSALSKYQLIHAISAPAFFASIWGMWRLKIDLVWLYVFAGLSSILPAAMLFGCVKSTWNHTWVYTTILLMAFPLEYLISKYLVWRLVLFCSGLILFINLLVMQANFFTTATYSYLTWLAILSLLALANVIGVRCEQR